MSHEKKPYFSIITVTKNSKKTLERVIRSLSNQTFQDFEHIIIDGGSIDGTINLIKKNRLNIKYFNSANDKNMWEAINKGIKKARGEIIGILNADDMLFKNGLLFVKKKFSYKRVDFVCATVRKSKVYHGFYKNKIDYKFNIFPSHSVGFYIRRNIQQKIGLYDDKLSYCADYDLIYRLIKKNYKGVHTPKAEVVGKFFPGGISEKISFIKNIYYQAKVRIKNNQNVFFVIGLSCLHVIYYYLKKFQNVKKF